MSPDTMQNPVLGTAAGGMYEIINKCTEAAQLDEAGRLLWRGYGEGKIDEVEAAFLSSCIEGRRPERRPAARAIDSFRSRISIFPARRYRASPDRAASRHRRRILGGSSALPDGLRHYYTEGQRSVLCVIAGEVKRQGICDLPIDKIGALAGACRTTVQNTIRLARYLGHLRVIERPRKRQKNLTNVIEIVATEWLAWVKRAPSAARRIGFTLSKIACPTKNTDQKEEEKREWHSNRWSRSGGHGPPGRVTAVGRSFREPAYRAVSYGRVPV